MPDAPMNLMSVLNECKVQEKATDADVQGFLNHKIPTDHNGKCLMACVLEKNGDVSALGQIAQVSGLMHLLFLLFYRFRMGKSMAKELRLPWQPVLDPSHLQMKLSANASLLKMQIDVNWVCYSPNV